MKHQKNQGFTLIEMIGVLAIIAILVGAVAPRIFEAIQESKANNASTLHKTVSTAVTKFYADMGFIGTTTAFAGATTMGSSQQEVDAAGNADSYSGLLSFNKTNSTATLDQTWARFRGPYLDGFVQTAPPIGTSMGIDLEVASTFGSAPSGADDENYDLDFDAKGDITDGDGIASLRYEDIAEDLFDMIDAIIDGGLGADPRLSGKVKYDGTTVRIYIRHD